MPGIGRRIAFHDIHARVSGDNAGEEARCTLSAPAISKSYAQRAKVARTQKRIPDAKRTKRCPFSWWFSWTAMGTFHVLKRLQFPSLSQCRSPDVIGWGGGRGEEEHATDLCDIRVGLHLFAPKATY
eukprot:2330352-Rhodomonas_salina.4